MKVRRGLRLYGVSSVALMTVNSWSESKSCVAYRVDVVTMYGLMNDKPGDVGCCGELYGLLVGVYVI